MDFLSKFRILKGWPGLVIGLVLLVSGLILIFGWLWSSEPGAFNIQENAMQHAGATEEKLVPGYVLGATLSRVASTMLDKPGGYISNDVFPPGVFLDNIANWEFGVLVQVRDLARVMRNDFSRSQSQSAEDQDLAKAEPLFNFDNNSWIFPDSEGEYRKAISSIDKYLGRLQTGDQNRALFHARADNLRDWLGIVDKRLGSLAQRLSASVGQVRVDMDANVQDGAGQPSLVEVKTPWLEIDDVFYEARGTAWALIHFLQAAEVDFGDVLAKKNATLSLKQIIRDLQATQDTVWSPMILNGRGFGLVTNYSLIMTSYISQANAAVIDLRNLLA
ncbi:MAG: DUF2333 family protein, partial [Acidiferrobacterales bacterium]